MSCPLPANHQSQATKQQFPTFSQLPAAIHHSPTTHQLPDTARLASWQDGMKSVGGVLSKVIGDKEQKVRARV